jgi:uncharacterized membrane protein (DUF2068 family)
MPSMRVVPRTWDNETWVCSVRGHVVPAARVARLRPDDAALGVELDDGRLCRCLRCDLWVRTAPPAPGDVTSDVLPPVAELPKPRRGEVLEDAIITRLIACERALHCLLFTVAALVLVVVDTELGGLRDTANDLSASLQGMIDNSGRGGSHAWLVRHLDDVGTWHLDLIRVLLVVALAYAVLEGVEAWGLWHERRWAEYLTVVATAGFLPLELHELTERVTVLRLVFLVVNLAVLAWLVWAKRLFGLRGGRRSEPTGPDWDELLSAPAPAPEEARC